MSHFIDGIFLRSISLCMTQTTLTHRNICWFIENFLEFDFIDISLLSSIFMWHILYDYYIICCHNKKLKTGIQIKNKWGTLSVCAFMMMIKKLPAHTRTYIHRAIYEEIRKYIHYAFMYDKLIRYIFIQCDVCVSCLSTLLAIISYLFYKSYRKKSQ